MRRMWMLLLVVVLAVIVMAVPAMAAETDHTDHTDWTPISDGLEITADGNYVVSDNVSASVTVSGGNVTICLNGKEWSGNGTRPLTITGGSVTICDCSYVAPTVNQETGAVGVATGGKLVGYQYSGAQNSGNGGAVNVAAGASFTLESGIITDGHAENGGNIYNLGTVTISGGLVSDGETGLINASTNGYTRKGWGGNIENQGVLNINGGIISGGKAGGNGGNIRNTGTATLTMTDGVITGGDSRDNGGNLFIQCNTTLSGGLIIAGTANNGGNISANAGSKTIALSGVTIKNGVNCGGANANSQYGANDELVLNAHPGANVRIFNAAATLTINNGTVITGGQSSATDGSQNVYLGVTGSTLNLGTCTIDGYVCIVDTCTVNVTGAPEVTDGDINLRLGKSVLKVTDMTGGEVGITTTAGVSAAFTAAVTNTAFENYFTSDNEAFAVTYNYQDDKLWLGEAYCVCGASKNGGDHVQHTDADGKLVGCDGTILGWLKWTSATALPKGHGNFYLSADSVTFSAQYAPEANATMRLDLNGKVVTDTDARMIATATANSSGSVDLWITDTAANGGGTLKSTTNGYGGQGVIARIADSSTLHLVAGTIDARVVVVNISSKNYDGVALCIESGCTFNMYGGTIYGGSGARHGGAVRINGGAFLNMYGGTIYGGEVAEQGGAVSVAGTAYISGGTIQGGKAGYGGALAITAGTSVIKNCVIKDGVALRAETTYETPEDGSEPTVATVNNATGRGGNIYVASATVEMENCVISGGSIEFASGVYDPYELVYYTYEEDGVTVASESNQYNNWGATGIFVTSSANVTAEDCEIYGGTDLQEGVDYMAYQGGTIFINGSGRLTLKGDSVVTASPVKQKGAVIHRANGWLYIQDNTLIDASYYYTYNETTGEFEPDENAPVQANSGVAMNFDNGTGECVMTGGTVIGGEVIGTPKAGDGLGGGAIVMTGNTKFTFSGGTIKDGTSAYGGNIYVNKGTLTLNGGTIKDGTATAQGGNIYVYNGTVTMTAGTIQGGTAATNGGSVYINANGVLNMSAGTVKDGQSTGDQGGNIFCGGTMTLSGGTVSGGEARSAGGNIAINSSKNITISNVTIERGSASNGGNIAVNTTQKTGSVTIGDGASITGGTATAKGGNVWLNPNNANKTSPVATLNITGGTISGGTAAEGPNIQANDETDCTTNLSISGTCTIGGYPAVQENVNLTWDGAIVNGSYVTIYAMPDAISNAADGDLVTMLSDYAAEETLVIGKSLMLDLNNNDLSNVSLTNATLKLVDTATSAYSSADGYGKLSNVTLGEGASIARTCNTDKDVYGRNLRFLTIKEADGSYSAHRIYLAVKATVLYPVLSSTQNPAVGFRTVLRCDDVVKSYVEAYGLYVTADGMTVPGCSVFSTVASWDGSNDNSKVTGLSFSTMNQAETDFNGQAYLILNDSYGTAATVASAEDAVAQIQAGNAVTSSGSTLSLKALVVNADTNFASLSDTQKANLKTMYDKWSDTMSGWGLSNIAAYNPNEE